MLRDQTDSTSTEVAQYDVAIVGGGPAGAICGIKLAKAGYKVLILERLKLPRDKTCGDALIPDSIAVLKRAGIWDQIKDRLYRVQGMRAYSPSNFYADLDGEIYTCKRQNFDSLLLKQAEEAGCLVVDEANVHTSIERQQDILLKYHKDEVDNEVCARVSVVATGASTKSLKALNIEHRSEPSAYALRQYFYFDEPHGEDRLKIWYSKEVLPGYAWSFPIDEHTLNVGAGIFVKKGKVDNVRDIYDRFLTQCSEVSSLLSKGVRAEKISGAPIRASLKGSVRYSNRQLVIGEAIGTTYAMSGEGIGKAMESAEIAADVLIDAFKDNDLTAPQLKRYDERLESELREKFDHYENGQKWLAYPWVVDLLAKRAHRDSAVRDLLEEVLAEKKSPTEILSFWGVVKKLILRIH